MKKELLRVDPLHAEELQKNGATDKYEYNHITRNKKVVAKGFIAIHDVVWQNIKCTTKRKVIKRIISFFILIALFFILATPSVDHIHQAFVYFLKSNISFVRDFLNLEFVGTAPSLINYLIVEYLPGIWIALVNSLNLLLIDHLSRAQ